MITADYRQVLLFQFAIKCIQQNYSLHNQKYAITHKPSSKIKNSKIQKLSNLSQLNSQQEYYL